MSPSRSDAAPPAPLSSVFGYQEIFLRIMSYLSPTDLAIVQGVNRQWAKMSLDPQVSHERFVNISLNFSHAERDLSVIIVMVTAMETIIFR